MTARLLFAALLAAGLAQAELKLFLWAGGAETPVTPYMDVGSAATGETQEIRFRARNTGPGSVTVQTLSAKSSAFALYGPPDLPYEIAPGSFLNIFIRFQPTIAGTASAVFTVNTITVVLIGDARAAPVVQAGSVTVSNGSVIDWGPVERGVARVETITLRNLSSAAATVNRIDVQGAAFRLGAAVSTPLVVEVGQSYSFQVVFQPEVDGAQAGSLAVDDRNYELRGTGLAPPLPQPQLAPDAATAGSSQQMKLRVKLAASSKSSGSGTVQMQFKPADGLADDPTILFLPAGRVQMRWPSRPERQPGRSSSLSRLAATRRRRR
ncbi:MAG: choice-of-anchor D domain-containing protein [Acidobacteria bacterium]|nr:choice-of-anchor D domain-containing protein [Acidobacteriota bacterium]